MPFLEVIRSPALLGQKRFSLKPGRNLLGRDKQCDVCILDPRISSRHALMVVNGNHVEIFDQGSTNGTFLNQERKTRSLWSYGQLMRVGDTDIALRSDPPAGPTLLEKPQNGNTTVYFNETPLDINVVKQVDLVADADPGDKGDKGEYRKLLGYSRIMHRVVKAVPSMLSVTELLDTVMNILFEAIHCHTGYILLVDPENPDNIREHLAYENGHRIDNLDRKLYSRTLVERVLRSRLGFIFDVDESGPRDSSLSILDLRIKTAISCPIHSEGKVFGVIYLDNKSEGNKYGEEDLELLMSVSGIIGVAVENLQLYRKLKMEALIRDNLKRFVSPNIAEKIIADQGRGNFHLRSQKSELTVLFADIRGFTPLAENLMPLEVVHMLNIYFSEMSTLVFANGGTLDKFIGDGMMVLFNAPFPMPHHEYVAVKTAMDMQRCLFGILPKLTAKGIPQFSVGIGINCGDAVVGSIGTQSRMDYTAIGDCVNVAARACSAAEPGQILITSNMREKVSGYFRTRSLGLRELKGKSRPQELFEVLGELTE